MSKLIVEIPEENARFIFRYSVSDQIRKTLQQNAEVTEPITPEPTKPRRGKLPHEIEQLEAAEPAEDPQPEEAAELNDGTATRAAKKILADSNLELANVPADGGRVGVDHVRAYIAG